VRIQSSQLARAAALVGATLLLAAVYWLVVGRPFLGVDTIFALTWGRDIAHLRLPDYAVGPTPHPLTNVVGAVLSPLGTEGAYHASQGLALIYLAILLIVLFLLAKELAGVAVAVLTVAIFGSSFGLVSRAMIGFYDIPALALLLGALLSAVREPRPGWRTAVLLLLAGLIRPEFWLYCVLYAAYAVIRGEGRVRWRIAAVPLAAPVIWVLTDWIVTGHPLFSLTHTQDLAGTLGRRTGISEVPGALFDGLRIQVARAVLVAGLVGILLAATSRDRRRFAPLVVILAAVLMSYVLTGLAKLSLIDRYLLPAGAVFSIFAAYAAVGWTAERGGRLDRRVWVGVGVIVLAVLLLTVPNRVDSLSGVRKTSADRNALVDDLHSLAANLPACRPIHLYRDTVGIVQPTVTYVVGDTSGDPLGLKGAPARGLFIAPRSRQDALPLQNRPTDAVSLPRLPGTTAQTRHWSWWRAGCA
jgi:hypothetical protein